MGMIYAPPSIIPNGALINNICHIYQTTKPTTRPNGSALMIGDKWYNTTGENAFWSGSYWLSELEKYSYLFGGNTQGTGNATYYIPGAIDCPIIITSIGWIAANDVYSTTNATNFLTFTYMGQNTSFDFGLFIGSFTSKENEYIFSSVGNYHAVKKTVNVFSATPILQVQFNISETGSVGNWANGTNKSNVFFTYRKVF